MYTLNHIIWSRYACSGAPSGQICACANRFNYSNMIWGLVSAHQVDAAGEGGDEVVEPPPALEKNFGGFFLPKLVV